jgi:hypothetical protein
MCSWTKLAAANFALALGLAAIFRLQELSDAVAIMLITSALSVAQVLYWTFVCNGFRR